MLIRVRFIRLIGIKIVITVIILRDVAELINGLIGLFAYSFIVQNPSKVAEPLCGSVPENISFIAVNQAVQFSDNCPETYEIIEIFVIIFVVFTILFTVFG